MIIILRRAIVHSTSIRRQTCHILLLQRKILLDNLYNALKIAAHFLYSINIILTLRELPPKNYATNLKRQRFIITPLAFRFKIHLSRTINPQK